MNFWAADLIKCKGDVFVMMCQKLGCMDAIVIDQGGGMFLPFMKNSPGGRSLKQNHEGIR